MILDIKGYGQITAHEKFLRENSDYIEEELRNTPSDQNPRIIVLDQHCPRAYFWAVGVMYGKNDDSLLSPENPIHQGRLTCFPDRHCVCS